GFEGVELDAPHGPDKTEALAASEKTGLPIDGMVNDVHWKIRMSDPDAATRAKSIEHMLEAIRQCKQCGGHTVLLVPGHGNDGSVEEVEARALEAIRKCLPLCAKLGVYMAIENVWNHMFYDHNGPADQSAKRLADFVDRCNSPWVGVQFDIGNHQKYGKPAEWIRTLGKRIVKLDVKDWGKANGFCKIGDGDVDWEEVCLALNEIRYTGYAAAEVAGGDRKRMAEIAERMNRCLQLA
ncbi:MAG: sugar phosphate isomerase/epimerase, partial [Rhodospirillales bacterium]|nr:sugar phosphate isomerase/epimerase [Rhodospirillales bacterium]